MAFGHRKLLEDSIDVNSTKFCDLFCVPNNDIDGYCQRYCLLVQFPPTSLPDSIPNLHHRYKSPNLHLYLSISFALLVTVLFLFACFLIYRYFRIRRSSTPPENGGDRELRDEFVDEERGSAVDHPIWYIRTVGLQPSIINAITVCKYRKSDGLVDGAECSVCLSEFEEDETLRLLPKCSHAFHVSCIDTWLRSHTNCPNCRAIIFSPPSPIQAATQETAGIGIGIDTIQQTIHEESGPESAPLDRQNEIRDTRGDEDFRPIMRRSVSASIMSAVIDDAYPDQYDANSNSQLENSVPKKVKGSSQSLIRLIEGDGDTSSSVVQSGIRPCLGKRSFSCSVIIKVLSR